MAQKPTNFLLAPGIDEYRRIKQPIGRINIFSAKLNSAKLSHSRHKQEKSIRIVPIFEYDNLFKSRYRKIGRKSIGTYFRMAVDLERTDRKIKLIKWSRKANWLFSPGYWVTENECAHSAPVRTAQV